MENHGKNYQLCLNRCWAYSRLFMPDMIADVPHKSRHFLPLKHPELMFNLETGGLDGAEFIGSNDEVIGYEAKHSDPRILLYRSGADKRDYFRITVTGRVQRSKDVEITGGKATLELITEEEGIKLYQDMTRKISAPKGLQSAAL